MATVDFGDNHHIIITPGDTPATTITTKPVYWTTVTSHTATRSSGKDTGQTGTTSGTHTTCITIAIGIAKGRILAEPSHWACRIRVIFQPHKTSTGLSKTLRWLELPGEAISNAEDVSFIENPTRTLVTFSPCRI
jgi:hypothetical protein